MRYSMDEIHQLIAKPGDMSQYTQDLRDELIAHLFDDSAHEDVNTALDLLREANLHLRIQIAALHSSKGSLDNLMDNVQLALTDYRDLLMNYY